MTLQVGRYMISLSLSIANYDLYHYCCFHQASFLLPSIVHGCARSSLFGQTVQGPTRRFWGLAVLFDRLESCDTHMRTDIA